jgi:undecaprenyl-diphosphatase
MTLIQAFILGIIQGLTEFLPISSSAHLVLIPYLFNWNFPQEQVFPFDVLVQLGTLVAVVLYFWKDLVTIIRAFFSGLANKEPFKDFEARMGWYLLLATIPAGILGMTIKSQVEAVFSNPTWTALLLFVTAGMLIAADFIGKRTRDLSEMTWLDALWMGLFQAVSIFPGISRSGATITGGMTRHLDRTSSARFSFLMSIPVMLGASIVSLKDLFEVPNLSSFLPMLFLGFITAAITGYLSIHWLLSFIKRQKFYYFAIYCVVVAVVVLLVSALRTYTVSASITTPQPTVVAETKPAETSLPDTTVDATAAGETPIAATPTVLSPVGFELIDISYSPAMAWTVPAMSSCTGVVNSSGLITHELPTASLDVESTNLVFRWGAPHVLSYPATQIGDEKIMVVVSQENPIMALDNTTARLLFSGQLETYAELRDACPDCLKSSFDSAFDTAPIVLGFYPKEEDIQQVFIDGVMSGQPVANSIGILIPDPQSMIEFVQSDKTAIGFIPAHALDANLRSVALNGYDAQALTYPLLVISKSVPTGNARDLLLCMQNVLNP